MTTTATMSPAQSQETAVLKRLPSDEVRRILWRFAERDDLARVVASARAVARGPVARLVAGGARNSHEWTAEKAKLLAAFDEAGITALFVDPEHGGAIAGPKGLAVALAAFELAWVDGGAATCSMASHLALAPVYEKGTEEQKATYLKRFVPQPGGEQSGRDGGVWRGAFCLTEPLPNVGVDTGVLSGKVRVVEWPDGGEPILEVTKRGRFIVNMGFANFVTAAVDSGDERVDGSCMVILEEGDEGVFERGRPNRKLVHQIASTSNPTFHLKVPASRIVGGYTVRDGVIVPNHHHNEVIEAVFRRPRVTVGLMSAAKLLSAVEPIVRYQRERFRGSDAGKPGTPRYDMGLQRREDALHRLIDVWATGEAAASLGFTAARLLDEMDPLEHKVAGILAGQGFRGGRPWAPTLRKLSGPAREYLEQLSRSEKKRDPERIAELAADPVVEYVILNAVAAVLCPATKLWATGHGANQMREAVSLMGGFGITEECPGFLGQKWMDAQLEATYEGPEAVQRRQLSVTMTDEVFLAQFDRWIHEMREISDRRPGTGACTVASAMELWLWTMRHLRKSKDAHGKPLYRDRRQGITFPMADAMCWLVASRCQILDVLELMEKGEERPELAGEIPGAVAMLTDLCHVQASRAAGEVGRICADLVFGYNEHPSWEGDSALCYCAEELDALEGLIPGISVGARAQGDIFEAENREPKAGPCVRFDGAETFTQLRRRLDGCLTGARLAKDRAAWQLTQVAIPEKLDYPSV